MLPPQRGPTRRQPVTTTVSSWLAAVAPVVSVAQQRVCRRSTVQGASSPQSHPPRTGISNFGPSPEALRQSDPPPDSRRTAGASGGRWHRTRQRWLLLRKAASASAFRKAPRRETRDRRADPALLHVPAREPCRRRFPLLRRSSREPPSWTVSRHRPASQARSPKLSHGRAAK